MTKARPDVACDLSALGDGWAADRIAGALGTLGHEHVLVDVAGEVTARGRRADGRPWRVAVEWPGEPRERAVVIELDGAAAATSGDYKKAWTDAQGRRYSHILDPRAGRPVAHDLASVTVVDRDGAWADALATALMVLGPDEGRALAARERLAARFVKRQKDGSFAEWATPAFESLVPPRGRLRADGRAPLKLRYASRHSWLEAGTSPRMSDEQPGCDFDPGRLQVSVRKRVPGRLDALTPAVEEVMAEARGMECSQGKEFEIETALREALANAIRHGCGNDPDKDVEVCVACDPERGMLIVVRDPGPGFDPAQIPSPVRGQQRVPPPRAGDLPDQPADGRGLLREGGHRDPDAEAMTPAP